MRSCPCYFGSSELGVDDVFTFSSNTTSPVFLSTQILGIGFLINSRYPHIIKRIATGAYQNIHPYDGGVGPGCEILSFNCVIITLSPVMSGIIIGVVEQPTRIKLNSVKYFIPIIPMIYYSQQQNQSKNQQCLVVLDDSPKSRRIHSIRQMLFLQFLVSTQIMLLDFLHPPQ